MKVNTAKANVAGGQARVRLRPGPGLPAQRRTAEQLRHRLPPAGPPARLLGRRLDYRGIDGHRSGFRHPHGAGGAQRLHAYRSSAGRGRDGHCRAHGAHGGRRQSRGDACRFPPVGERSWGWGHARVYGADYSDWIDEQLFVAVQIESAAGGGKRRGNHGHAGRGRLLAWPVRPLFLDGLSSQRDD